MITQTGEVVFEVDGQKFIAKSYVNTETGEVTTEISAVDQPERIVGV